MCRRRDVQLPHLYMASKWRGRHIFCGKWKWRAHTHTRAALSRVNRKRSSYALKITHSHPTRPRCQNNTTRLWNQDNTTRLRSQDNTTPPALATPERGRCRFFYVACCLLARRPSPWSLCWQMGSCVCGCMGAQRLWMCGRVCFSQFRIAEFALQPDNLGPSIFRIKEVACFAYEHHQRSSQPTVLKWLSLLVLATKIVIKWRWPLTLNLVPYIYMIG